MFCLKRKVWCLRRVSLFHSRAQAALCKDCDRWIDRGSTRSILQSAAAKPLSGSLASRRKVLFRLTARWRGYQKDVPMEGPIRYARSGDVYIAYRIFGDGPRDIVLIPGTISHVEMLWEVPSYKHL